MPEFCLAKSKADCIVMGEGEETVVELIDALEAHRPLELIDGIAFRRGADAVVDDGPGRGVDLHPT